MLSRKKTGRKASLAIFKKNVHEISRIFQESWNIDGVRQELKRTLKSNPKESQRTFNKFHVLESFKIGGNLSKGLQIILEEWFKNLNACHVVSYYGPRRAQRRLPAEKATEGRRCPRCR